MAAAQLGEGTRAAQGPGVLSALLEMCADTDIKSRSGGAQGWLRK